jgi:hypothetical protein
MAEPMNDADDITTTTALPSGNPALQIARLITQPAPPPVWLEMGLASATEQLSRVIPFAAAYPTRAELRTRLEKARQAAAVLLDTLDDRHILPHIEAARAAANHTKPSLNALLPFANDLLTVVLPALTRARDNIRIGKGRDKQEPYPDRFSPQEHCAAFIAVAWQEVHGCIAPHSSTRAHKACEALWVAAGGSTSDRWGNTNGGWRGALKAVKATAHENRLQFLRRTFIGARTCLQLKVAPTD